MLNDECAAKKPEKIQDNNYTLTKIRLIVVRPYTFFYCLS